MIEISVTKTSVTVLGHAQYAERGNDIVCAAVSALTQTLIAGIESLSDDKINYTIKPGETTIFYKDLSERGQLLVDSFFIGISGISLSYGDNYVRLK